MKKKKHKAKNYICSFSPSDIKGDVSDIVKFLSRWTTHGIPGYKYIIEYEPGCCESNDSLEVWEVEI
jgi:hypothetical protein